MTFCMLITHECRYHQIQDLSGTSWHPAWYDSDCKALLVHTRATIPFALLSLLQSGLFLFALFDTALSLATMQRSAVTAVLLLLLAFLGEPPHAVPISDFGTGPDVTVCNLTSKSAF